MAIADGHALGLDPTAAALKRVQRTTREALAAVRELERVVGADFVGRFDLPAGQREDLGELLEFVQLTVADSPRQDLSIIVVAAPPQGG